MNSFELISKQETHLADLGEMLDSDDFALSTFNSNLSWQPSAILPVPDERSINEIRDEASKLTDKELFIIAASAATEEGLPTYTSRLQALQELPDSDTDSYSSKNKLNQFFKNWAAEEHRHGKVMSNWMWLTGRFDMPSYEWSIEKFISDGMVNNAGNDPYKFFVYTSYQESATMTAHFKMKQIAKDKSCKYLANIFSHCGKDEARHARTYKKFVRELLKVDTNNMLIAIADMLSAPIELPGNNFNAIGYPKDKVYDYFSDVSQNIGGYNFSDYVNILSQLVRSWGIEEINSTSLSPTSSRARDSILKTIQSLKRLLERKGPILLKNKNNLTGPMPWIKY